MAVAVDISGSKHLSYSPLNKKHNILYSSARQSYNQRYKQKPWFRLNPFTDKDVGKVENIERYDPECDAGLSPLQSLVIVEDYFSDVPQFTREFNISEFWDFLFSDSWSNGYSVRVLEGQLLEMMTTCLHSLTHAAKVIQNVTKAYAKTKRQKYSMVTKKAPELKSFTETLLLKFVYYGNLVKPACFDQESSVGYPDVTTATNSSCVHETIDFKSLGNDATSSMTGFSAWDSKPPSPPATEPQSLTQHPRKRRVRAPKEMLNQVEKERVLLTRFMSHKDSIKPIPPPIPRNKNYRYTCSNFSNASDDYKSLPPRVDLNRFVCTEKVSYLGEFNLPDDSGSSSSSSGEDDEDVDGENFGQHYYLGDPEEPIRRDVFESTEIKLKKRKEIIQEMRKEKKLQIAQLEKPIPEIMPEFSELDVKKYVKDHKIINVTRVPESDNVPTLEEYANYLHAELKRELKSKMIKQNVKQSVKQSVIFKQGDAFMGKVGTRLPQLGLKITSKRTATTPAQRMILMKKMLKGKKKPKAKRVHKIVVPLVYLSLPSGKTFLHPISRQLMQIKMAEEEEKRREESLTKETNRRRSLLPSAGTALFNELQKIRQASKTSTSGGRDVHVMSPKFPKVKLVPLDATIESSDDEDDEYDDLEQNIFDSKTLNIIYSRDKIRKAKAAERAAEIKNKSKFLDALKKYCRIKSVLKALGGPAKKPRQKSPAGLRTKKSKTEKTNAINIVLRSQIAGVQSDQYETNQYADVGKLRKFAFLEAKEKTYIQSSQQMKSLFENYPMELFCENLERALNEFVVRKEMIVSDYNGKTLVSITFTKKSVFTTSKFSNNQ
ncbi:uncharacterized protein LOC123563010 [Mercenaria mercenaria]|uniref:uncharacterized protein LOC123563010 n=1 Tax=Mercenaria mercenaria TaxID=6596 RepID=UPI00234F602F|nr:uncharacterized protein LOC123563010 [Mercenaria mercenaria]